MKKQNPALTQPPVTESDTSLPPIDESKIVADEVANADAQKPDDAATAEPSSAGSPEGAAAAEPSGAGLPEDAATAEPSAAGSPDDSPAERVVEGPDGASGMTGEDPPAFIKPPPEPPGTDTPKPSRAPLLIALLALVGVALIGWQVWELRVVAKETRQEVAQRLATGDGAVSEIRALTRQQQEATAALQSRFGALQSQVEATEGQAAALEALYIEYSRSRSDQALAEVEQAINIAAQQLHLAGNFEAALIALQGAEARLAMPDQGHLQALRRALIKDIDELKEHPQVDVSGLALRLEILLERLDSLPLAFEVQLAEAAAAREQAAAERSGAEGPVARSLEFLRALSADIWGDIKGMVRLERMDQSDPVLLAPAQSTYLRENVKIRLLTARLALLARDGRTYSADLRQARGWIERYFDVSDEQVKRVVADLAELEQVSIKAEAPALSDTFAALRLVQARTAPSRPPGVEREGSAESSAINGPR